MNINSNIKKIYFIKAFTSMFLIAPVITLFFLDLGLSFAQIMLLQSIFAFTVLIMELPSGFLADVIGRKKSIVIGGIFCLAGITIYSLSYNFWQLTIGEILLAFAWSFFSGADSALIYDTLLSLKKEKSYKEIEGKAHYYEMLANIIGASFAGLIASFNLRYVFFLTIPFILARVIISFTLKEPKRKIKRHKKGYIYHLYKICRFALHKNKEVRLLTFY